MPRASDLRADEGVIRLCSFDFQSEQPARPQGILNHPKTTLRTVVRTVSTQKAEVLRFGIGRQRNAARLLSFPLQDSACFLVDTR
jgi:hypothetical protein